MARQYHQVKDGAFTATAYQYLYDQFLVASGHLAGLLTGIIDQAAPTLLAGGKVSVNDMNVAELLNDFLRHIKPAELPRVFADLTAGVTVMGPDPLDGNKMCTDLSPESLNEVYGENPMFGFKVLGAVVQLNFTSFLTKAGISWTTLPDPGKTPPDSSSTTSES